jgi:hypothetical protein
MVGTYSCSGTSWPGGAPDRLNQAHSGGAPAPYGRGAGGALAHYQGWLPARDLLPGPTSISTTSRARRLYSPFEQAAKDDQESVLAALLETGSAEARAELLVQQANFAAATQSTSVASAHQARAAWLHSRKTPSPLLSRSLMPTGNTAWRCCGRRMAPSPRSLAIWRILLTSHFAAVSTAATTSPAVQDAVLQAMAAGEQTGGSKRVPALHSRAAGIPSVTVGAVLTPGQDAFW